MGCIESGVGTIDPLQYEVITYDFDNPSDVDLQSDNQIPGEYRLRQNYPNPFNPSTSIVFTLPRAEYVKLKVINMLGKDVATLVSAKLNRGTHTYQFDGRKLASGTYAYQLQAGKFKQVKKMMLLK